MKFFLRAWPLIRASVAVVKKLSPEEQGGTQFYLVHVAPSAVAGWEDGKGSGQKKSKSMNFKKRATWE